MTALDLVEIKELYNFPLQLYLDKGMVLYSFNEEEITIAEDVGGGYETLSLPRPMVFGTKYMRVELDETEIIKAIMGKK